jgi:SAM-dependent methyltransferase
VDVRERPREPFRRHPWEHARYRFFRERLARRQNGHAPRVLDVGAGDAWFATQLLEDRAAAHVTCWDAAYDDPAAADFHPEATSSLSFTGAAPPQHFERVLMLDVLEHVDDDAGFLRQVVDQNLAPEGWLLASVPAWPALYGNHDVALHHHRRYTPAGLTALLRSAQLEPVEGGGLFHSLLLPRVAQNLADRARQAGVAAPDGRWRHGELLARVVEGALAIDTHLSSLAARAHVQVPGLTVWALCRHAR